MSKWDTAQVADMQNMFELAIVFNGDVSKWDTAKVTYIFAMFNQATVFNGDVSKWDTAKVTGMDNMFFKASKFNQDLSKWDTALVLDGKCTDFALNSGCPIDANPSNGGNMEQQTCKARLENCTIDTDSS